MLVQVTNNTKYPVYVDIVGDNQPEHIHILGSKAKETLSIDYSRLEDLKTEHGNKVLFKKLGVK